MKRICLLQLLLNCRACSSASCDEAPVLRLERDAPALELEPDAPEEPVSAPVEGLAGPGEPVLARVVGLGEPAVEGQAWIQASASVVAEALALPVASALVVAEALVSPQEWALVVVGALALPAADWVSVRAGWGVPVIAQAELPAVRDEPAADWVWLRAGQDERAGPEADCWPAHLGERLADRDGPQVGRDDLAWSRAA